MEVWVDKCIRKIVPQGEAEVQIALRDTIKWCWPMNASSSDYSAKDSSY